MPSGLLPAVGPVTAPIPCLIFSIRQPIKMENEKGFFLNGYKGESSSLPIGYLCGNFFFFSLGKSTRADLELMM